VIGPKNWARVLNIDWEKTPGKGCCRVVYGAGFYIIRSDFGELRVEQMHEPPLWYIRKVKTKVRIGTTFHFHTGTVQGERGEITWKTPEEAAYVAMEWLVEHEARYRLGG
jgi:hypothetical protein